MKAAIHYEMNGRRYTYRGQWPGQHAERIEAAQARLYESRGYPPFTPGDLLTPSKAAIEAAGGRFISAEGTRPDGTIRAEDLRDYVIF